VTPDLIDIQLTASLGLDEDAHRLLLNKSIRDTVIPFALDLLLKRQTDRQICTQKRIKNVLNLEWRFLIKVSE
jgi:hypothetical protein